jgi:uncharacterized membrane protein SirB2
LREDEAMSYLLLKNVHIFCVAAGFSLLFVRGLWMMRVYPPAPELWVRMLPHAIDAVLVLSALYMLLSMPRLEWPAWMLTKLTLVVVYVLLAVMMTRGTSRLQKVLDWVMGMLIYLHMTSVAVLKSPLGIASQL